MASDKVEMADKIVGKLEAKLKKAGARKSALDEERRARAYGAQTGDGEARKALDKLDEETARLDLEIETIGSAIAEARRRLVAAENAESVEALRVTARGAAADAEELARLAAEWDDTAARLRAITDAFIARARKLSRVAEMPHAPNHRSLELAIARALSSCMRIPAVLELPLVPPGQRQALADVAQAHVAGVEAWAATVLGEVKVKAA